jgi:YVTN family beta-propeller protein
MDRVQPCCHHHECADDKVYRGMRYLRVQSLRWPAAGALLILAGLTGCGSQYRPVINPITKTGPPAQPLAYVAVFSQPGQQAASADTDYPCPGTQPPYLNPGVVTVLDSSGDSVAAQATLGNGPITFAMDPSGSYAFSQNCDGTLSSMVISGSLMSKNVSTSALLPGSRPINSLILSSAQEYIVEQGGPNHNAIAAMTSNPPELKTEISDVAPSVINLTGIPTSQRIYSISQGNTLSTAGDLPWGSCGTPSSVTVNGEADGIQTSTDSISSRIPLGVCPVYGVTSPDGRRAFILNRGSGTITVINTQTDQLDTINASPHLSGTGTINLCNGAVPCNAGPVYADFYAPSNLLVVANYDNDTVSVIDTSLVESGVGAGNDSPNFGNVLATIPVGHQPAALTVLQDPTNTRAYVANKGDGTVSVVSLTSFTPLSTITLPVQNSVTPQPRSIVSNFNYPIGKVYVSAQNSPYVTVIRTDTDVISAQILVQGNVADIHIDRQYAALASSGSGANSQIDSRSVGSGAP